MKMLHKKQYYQILVDTLKWNDDRGLLEKEDRKLESYMMLEELYEGIGIPDPKSEARKHIDKLYSRSDLVKVSDVEWLDSRLDLGFINFGSMGKMNLTPENIVDASQAVLDANNTKPSTVNKYGKIDKPDAKEWEETLNILDRKLEYILSGRKGQ